MSANPSTDTTAANTSAASNTVEARIVFALRQAALLVVCLLVGGAVVSRMRPVEAVDRGIVATPFVWAAALWLFVLVFHAIAFERSQMRRLEREPLMFACAVGVIVFALGVANFNAGEVGRRILYLGTNAIGSVLFWWAIFSFIWLLWLTIAPSGEAKPSDSDT